jgi:hypothetical protein
MSKADVVLYLKMLRAIGSEKAPGTCSHTARQFTSSVKPRKQFLFCVTGLALARVPLLWNDISSLKAPTSNQLFTSVSQRPSRWFLLQLHCCLDCTFQSGPTYGASLFLHVLTMLSLTVRYSVCINGTHNTYTRAFLKNNFNANSVQFMYSYFMQPIFSLKKLVIFSHAWWHVAW